MSSFEIGINIFHATSKKIPFPQMQESSKNTVSAVIFRQKHSTFMNAQYTFYCEAMFDYLIYKNTEYE